MRVERICQLPLMILLNKCDITEETSSDTRENGVCSTENHVANHSPAAHQNGKTPLEEQATLRTRVNETCISYHSADLAMVCGCKDTKSSYEERHSACLVINLRR
jgi:hypothetical protein